MTRETPPIPVLGDPKNVRDGTNPEIDAAVEAKVKELLEERLTAAVQEATAPLQNTIDRITQNRDSILREKRALEQSAVREAEQREAERPKFVPITREQARDPQAYRRAKEEAAERGVPLKFFDADEVEPRGEPPTTFASDTTLFVYAPHIKSDHTAYRRHKADAERRGLRLLVATKPEHFPNEAFEGNGE